MHELLLYGQVPRTRHEQVLKVLAGVAAMQPRRILKRHIVYKPQREPDEPGSHLRRGGTQAVQQAAKHSKQTGQKDLYFTQLVRPLSEEDFGPGNGTQEADGRSLVAKDGARWSMEFNDVPEAGDRGGVLVRLTNSSEIIEGDAHAYMISGGNQ
jgi:mediator of RNA polymerase II transcription subunit 18, fungi type